MKTFAKFLAFGAGIVVVGAGILWFVVGPRAAEARGQFLQETHLVSQLEIVVNIQELFFDANRTFTSSVDELEAALDWQLHESTDLRITAADSSGWAAWEELIGSDNPVRCHVYVGGTRPPFPEITEGEPWCETL